MALESNSFFRSFASMRKFRGSLTTDFHGSNDKSHILEFHSRKQWKAHFDSLKETDKLLVIDFTAEWCGPCKLMDPSVKEYAAKYTDVKFAKIDVDELVDVAAAFGVQTLPAFIMIKREKVVDKVVGARKKNFRLRSRNTGFDLLTNIYDRVSHFMRTSFDEEAKVLVFPAMNFIEKQPGPEEMEEEKHNNNNNNI